MLINSFILSVIFFGNSLSNSQVTLVPTRKPLNPTLIPNLVPTLVPSVNPSVQYKISLSLIPTMKPSLHIIINSITSTPSLLNTTPSSSPNVKSSDHSHKKKVRYLLSIILPCVLGPLFLLSILFIYLKYFVPVTSPKEYVITYPILPDEPFPDEPINETIISRQPECQTIPTANAV